MDCIEARAQPCYHCDWTNARGFLQGAELGLASVHGLGGFSAAGGALYESRSTALLDGDRSERSRLEALPEPFSPLLANIYPHDAIDLWAERWRERETTGDHRALRR
jgi:hypothetical protein